MGKMGSADNFSGGANPGPAFPSGTAGGGTGAPPRKRIAANQVTSTLQQAQTFQTQGHFNDAIDLCERILESGFDRSDTRYFLGWLYLEQQRYDDAICQFQMLLNDPDYALSSHYALGQCYRAHGDLRRATTHFDEAVERVDLDYLIIEEAEQLIQLCQETIEAHQQLGEQERALTFYHALLGFLRSRGWSEKVAQVELMLEQLQNSPSLSPGVPFAPALAAPPPQRHALSRHVRQWVTRQLHLVLSKQRAVLIGISLLLLIGIGLDSLRTGIWLHNVYQNPHPTNPTVVLPSKATPPTSTTSAAASTVTPSPSVSVNLAGSYYGTLHDLPTDVSTNISLSRIQQKQGNISGYLSQMPENTPFNGIPQNGPFTGTLNAAQQIQFTVTNEAGQATFSFVGLIQAGGDIVGTYCSLGAATGKCSDYGLWSVSPGT